MDEITYNKKISYILGANHMVIKKGNRKPPPIVNLKYRKGELIIKEGDYGISIYKIITGKVQIFTHSAESEVTLAFLGPGEIIGEMAFLSKDIEARSASAKAEEDSELEVWHPDLLSHEYDNMPPIIKHITDEALNRLIRMNRLIARMTSRKEEENSSAKEQNSGRRHYRKDVDLPCTYRPVGSSSRLGLNGTVKNISLSGVNMETREKTAAKFSYDPGDEFHIDLTLPGGKDVQLTAKILSSRKPRVAGMLSLGMVFTDMREGSHKDLGFFLMP